VQKRFFCQNGLDRPQRWNPAVLCKCRKMGDIGGRLFGNLAWSCANIGLGSKRPKSCVFERLPKFWNESRQGRLFYVGPRRKWVYFCGGPPRPLRDSL